MATPTAYDLIRSAVRGAFYTAAILAVVIVPHAIAYAAVPAPGAAVEGGLIIPACATEDSTGCFWDASEQGNGQGKDLWN